MSARKYQLETCRPERSPNVDDSDTLLACSPRVQHVLINAVRLQAEHLSPRNCLAGSTGKLVANDAKLVH